MPSAQHIITCLLEAAPDITVDEWLKTPAVRSFLRKNKLKILDTVDWAEKYGGSFEEVQDFGEFVCYDPKNLYGFTFWLKPDKSLSCFALPLDLPQVYPKVRYTLEAENAANDLKRLWAERVLPTQPYDPFDL